MVLLVAPRKLIAGFALLVVVAVFLLLLIYTYRSAALDRAVRPLLVEYLQNNLSPDATIGRISISGQQILIEDLWLGGGVEDDYQIKIKRLTFPFERELFTKNSLTNLVLDEPIVVIDLSQERVQRQSESFEFVSPINIASLVVRGGEVILTKKGQQLMSFNDIAGELSIAKSISFALASSVNNQQILEVAGEAYSNGSPLITLSAGHWNHKVFLKQQSSFKFLPQENYSWSLWLEARALTLQDVEEILSYSGIAKPEFLSAASGEFAQLEFSYSHIEGIHSFTLESDSGSLTYDNFTLAELNDVRLKATNSVIDYLSFSAGEARLGKYQLSEIDFKGTELSYHDKTVQGEVKVSVGNPDIRADFVLSQDRVRIRSMALEDFTYFSADGLKAVTDGSLAIKGNIRSIFSHSPEGNLVLDFRASELLYDSFYSDFSDQSALAELGFVFDTEKRLLALTSSRLAVSNLGELSMAGRVFTDYAFPRAEITGQIKIPDSQVAYQTYFSGMFSQTLSALDQLEISGQLSSVFSLSIANEIAIESELYADKLSLVHKPWSLEVREISGAVPFVINRRSHGASSTRRSSLSIASAALGVFSLRQNTLEFESFPNRMALSSALEWVVADGSFHIDALEARFGEFFEVSARSRIAGVDLAKLTQELGLVAMAGRISGDLGEVVYSQSSIITNGTILIDVFGGQITLQEIKFQDPFTPYSKLRGDLKFSAINLYDLTHTFSFGEINGIIDGAISSLEMLGFIPIEFDAFVRTRARGSRNISVKALNNIGVISQGRVMSALERGVYKFIDFYRYQAMAFDCRLRNDVFYLQGRAKPGSEEYLIYGGILPPKINVVSPYRNIPFKEMVNRIKRLERAGTES